MTTRESSSSADRASLIAELEQEIRTVAMIAGQASLEEIDPLMAQAEAKFAEYATGWADRLAALAGRASQDLRWRPIATAPKDIVWTNHANEYGRYILAYPTWGGGAARIRWWQRGEASNFLDDGGNAAHPTHWMPMPPSPQRTDQQDEEKKS